MHPQNAFTNTEIITESATTSSQEFAKPDSSSEQIVPLNDERNRFYRFYTRKKTQRV